MPRIIEIKKRWTPLWLRLAFNGIKKLLLMSPKFVRAASRWLVIVACSAFESAGWRPARWLNLNLNAERIYSTGWSGRAVSKRRWIVLRSLHPSTDLRMDLGGPIPHC